MARGDRDDAELVAQVAVALRAWGERSGRQPPTKSLRETVWFFWQEPRLDRPRVSGKYPRSANWSEEAARLVLDKEPYPNRLVIEDIVPLNRTLACLLEQTPPPELIVEELPERIEFVVVTAHQSKLLPDSGNPAERYAHARLDLDHFRPLDFWQDAS